MDNNTKNNLLDLYNIARVLKYDNAACIIHTFVMAQEQNEPKITEGVRWVKWFRAQTGCTLAKAVEELKLRKKELVD